jgi:hypothetical protein
MLTRFTDAVGIRFHPLRGRGRRERQHLFLAIISDRGAVPTQVLARRVDLDQAAANLRAVMPSGGYHTSSPFVSPEERE